MWFKQIQLFQLTSALQFSVENFIEKLESLAFKPCLPSMPSSAGWVSPVDEDGAPLVRRINDYTMICMQVEEKILPAAVVRQALVDKIKHIEKTQDRKVRPKEKLPLKDEIIMTLLPRAFSKLTRIYGYIDTKNNWLVLSTTQEKKVEQFISLFKKSLTEGIHPFEIKKISPTLTHWLKHQSYPNIFAIEKSCVLQDPNQQNRVIRCQHQDLFANSIQGLIKDGCEVKQVAMSWHDRVNFVLTENFSVSGIKFHDDVTSQVADLEAETKQQQFDADFLIMSETLSSLMKDLVGLFITKPGVASSSETRISPRSIQTT